MGFILPEFSILVERNLSTVGAGVLADVVYLTKEGNQHMMFN